MPWLLGIEDGTHAAVEFFGGKRLYRPGSQIQHQLRIEAEDNLRQAYGVGAYTDPQKINEILQHQFSFYESILNDKLPVVASRRFLEFIFSQYDIAAEIERQFKQGRLCTTEAVAWRELGPCTRRSMKYLAEAVTRLSPSESSPAPKHALFHIRDIVWICAEQVLRLSQVSDQTYRLVPDRTVFEAFPEGGDVNTRLSVRDFDDEFFRRVSTSRDNEPRYLTKPDLDSHFRFVDAAFKQTFGATFGDIRRCFSSLINDMPADSITCNVPLSPKQWVIEQTANDLSITEAAAERLLSGFTVTKQAMDEEPRLPWKPTQGEHRAFYRGFFEIPTAVGPMLTWSRQRKCNSSSPDAGRMQLASGVRSTGRRPTGMRSAAR